MLSLLVKVCKLLQPRFEKVPWQVVFHCNLLCVDGAFCNCDVFAPSGLVAGRESRRGTAPSGGRCH